jgi:hypothetical protein
MITPSGEVTAKVKSDISWATLDAAIELAVVSKRLELTSTEPSTESRDPYFSSALGAVILAACFLESSVNELLLHAVHGSLQFFPKWSKAEFQLMGEFWKQLEDLRAPTLRKVQVSLLGARKEPFLKGDDSYQAAESLVRLRNGLAHYKPEWSDDLDVHADIELRLRGKFPENARSHPSQVFFPHRCLGAGCAIWACRAAARFVTIFTNRLEASPHKLGHIEASIARLGDG